MISDNDIERWVAEAKENLQHNSGLTALISVQ